MTRLRAVRTPGIAVGSVVALGILLGSAVALGASPRPGAIPLADDGRFLGNLSAPVLTPGSTGAISYSLGDPLTGALSGVTLTFAIYAFAPAPGGSVQAVPSNGVVFDTGPTGTAQVSVQYGTLPPGVAPRTGALPVLASGGAADGAYDVRVSLVFTENGTSYRMESRGFFSAQAWDAAALPNGPNGTPDLNLSKLGVAGILPETAVGVDSGGWSVPIAALVVGGVALAAAGAFVYVRRGPGSTRGAGSAPPPQSAPSAVGK